MISILKPTQLIYDPRYNYLSRYYISILKEHVVCCLGVRMFHKYKLVKVICNIFQIFSILDFCSVLLVTGKRKLKFPSSVNHTFAYFFHFCFTSGILKLLGADTFQILGLPEELTLCLYEMSSLSLGIFLDLKSTCIIFIFPLQLFDSFPMAYNFQFSYFLCSCVYIFK